MSAHVAAAPRRSGSGFRWFYGATIVLVLVAGILVRTTDLGRRPVHTDEAVNAYQTAQVLAGHGFRYNPRDYHGPLFIALTAATGRVAGASDLSSLTEQNLRLGAVISSLLGMAFLFPYRRVVGWIPTITAAVFLAADPIFIYYGRYAIHESLLISLTLGFLIAGQLAWETGLLRWAIATGLCAGLMLATKETAVISFACAMVAAAICLPRPKKGFTRPMIVAFSTGILSFAFCFTWGFQNWVALLDLGRSGHEYLLRAGGQGHEKPLLYYAGLILSTKSGIATSILAVVGAAGAWFCKPSQPNGPMLGLYALLVFFVYSIIPYKTPWLALNLWLPVLLLAGLGVFFIFQRSILFGVLAFGVILFTMILDTRSRVFCGGWDERNPLAYSHPTDDILSLPTRIESIRAGLGHPLRIGVMATDPWPVPWYLRGEKLIGYWPPDDPMPTADVFILDQTASARLQLEEKGWRCWIFSQRPGSLLRMYWRPHAL